MTMFKFAASVLIATELLSVLPDEVHGQPANLAGCVDKYDDPNVDLFPFKYEKPTVASYGDVDAFGQKFVPHNTTDYLDISYHNSYKIVTNLHQDPPRSYLLYQCGTDPPMDVIDAGNFDLVLSVPHKGGLVVTQTTQIPYLEMLGLREEIIGYFGDVSLVSSPCLQHMMNDGTIEVGYAGYGNTTGNAAIKEEFLTRHPDAIVFSGPTNNVEGDRVMVASATQEKTNVATFDWVSFYAALYNLEGEAAKISRERQESYDCASDVARDIAAEQRELNLEFKPPTIVWVTYFSCCGLNAWGSIPDCAQWDDSFKCEYSRHCDVDVLSRKEGTGFNQTWGTETYWYLSDDEFVDLAKDADVVIYTGRDFLEKVYPLKNETLDQLKAVQNKAVYDTEGLGPGAWFEQRYAEYDRIGLDVCDVVGHVRETGEKHERRWLRNVFTEKEGSLGECDVPDEISRPYTWPLGECARPRKDDPATQSAGHSSAVASSLGALLLAVVSFVVN